MKTFREGAVSRLKSPRRFPAPGKFLALLLTLLAFAGLTGAAINREGIRASLGSVTGEDDVEKQVRAFPEWLSGIVRQPPDTADYVPIAYNGVNPFGVNTFLNQEVEDKKRALQLDMIRAAGFHWIRQEFPWEDIEIHAKGDFIDRRNAKPVSAWDKYDSIVRMANERGIQVIARLSTPPRWSRKSQDAIATTPPDKLSDFGDFVDAVVKHFKGQINYYQIWNEPNVYPEWGDQEVSPEGYVELLKTGYTRAKAVDPDVVILSAPLAPTIELGPRDMNDFVFLQRMYDAGARNFFDILSINDYGLWSGPSDRRMRPRVLNFSRPLYVRDIMVHNGDEHKAIWASEIGWNAIPLDHPAVPAFGRASDAQVARYIPAAYERAQQEWPWMGVMAYWFFKRATDAEQDQAFYFFRMVNPDFEALPVYGAFKQYANQPATVYPGYFQEDHWAMQYTGQWPIVTEPKAVLGKYRSSTRVSDALEFSFYGTGLDVVFVQGLAGGTVRVSIDDRPPQTLDLETPQETFGVRSRIASGLARSRHRARIEVVTPVVGVDGVVVYP
jgi:polysaccharide biosynthesis protein PslG